MLTHAHLVAGLEAGGAQGGDDANLVEPLLEVGQRLFVVDVVALEEELNAAASDAVGAIVLAFDRVAALARRPVDPVLDLEFAS